MRLTKEEHAHRMLQCSTRDQKTGKVILCLNLLGDTISDSIVSKKGHIYLGENRFFAQPSDYIKLFATILNNSVSPHTGYHLLFKPTIKEMLTDQFPDIPIDAKRTSMTLLDPVIDLSLACITTNGVPPGSQGISWFF